MNFNKIEGKTKVKWIPIVALAVSSLAIGFLLMQLLPDKKGLVLFGLYSIPSHLLISLFPHEPMLLFYAKTYSPWLISFAALIGCCIAAIFDYWLLVPFFNHNSIRNKFEDKKFFQKSLALFHKFPFGVLAIASYFPVPFYPFKFLSFAGKYPFGKYISALIIGRTSKYYTLAVLGYILQPPTWVLVLMFLVFVIPPVLQKASSWAKSRNKDKNKTQITPEYNLEDPEYIFSEYDELIQARERHR